MKNFMSHEDANPKLIKTGTGTGKYSVLSLSLAPADLSGVDICPFRTAACTEGCLGHNSGHSVMGNNCANNRFEPNMVRDARIFRTQTLTRFTANGRNAVAKIHNEIRLFVNRCAKKGVQPCVRMNAFSDLSWEVLWPELFTDFPVVQFYDYTKVPARMTNPNRPKNYHLTFSRSEENENIALRMIRDRFGIAVIFGTDDVSKIPATWNGFPVVDGTADDYTFLSPPGTVRGLIWKGALSETEYKISLANALRSGFAVSV